MAPRRNAATLRSLELADTVLAVGSGRSGRGAAAGPGPGRTGARGPSGVPAEAVLNKVRAAAVGRPAGAQLRDAWERLRAGRDAAGLPAGRPCGRRCRPARRLAPAGVRAGLRAAAGHRRSGFVHLPQRNRIALSFLPQQSSPCQGLGSRKGRKGAAVDFSYGGVFDVVWVQRGGSARFRSEPMRVSSPDYYEHLAGGRRGRYSARCAQFPGAGPPRSCAAHRPPAEPIDRESHDEPDSSVVYIVTDDMPFLVDSVNAELVRQHAPIHLVMHPLFVVTRNRGRRRLVKVARVPSHLGISSGDTAAMPNLSAPDRPGRQRLAHGILDRRRNRPRRRATSARSWSTGIRHVSSATSAPPSRTGRRCARQALEIAADLDGVANRAQIRRSAPGPGPAPLARRRQLHLPRLPRIRPRQRSRRGCRWNRARTAASACCAAAPTPAQSST